jgi:nitrite reductase/ring-hydroxylating ferredoxin subunit
VTQPAAPAALGVRVSNVTTLAHGQSLRFEFQRGKLKEEGFVLRWGDDLYAFANSCPHWSIDLDYGSGEFYDLELDRIVCRTHGALFHPQTGFCEWGPCSGRSLGTLCDYT